MGSNTPVIFNEIRKNTFKKEGEVKRKLLRQKRYRNAMLSTLLVLLLVMLVACGAPTTTGTGDQATPTSNLQATNQARDNTATAKDVACAPANQGEATIAYASFTDKDISGLCILRLTGVPLSTRTDLTKDHPIKLKHTDKGGGFSVNYYALC